MLDSLGRPDPNAYNAVHWNGQSWEFKRIMFYTICGQQSRSSYPAKSIFALNENEIWIAMDGDQIAKLENGIQVSTTCIPWSFSINKMWGSSSNDLYAVGNAGSIARYNGNNWSKLISGTEYYLSDIVGSNNGEVFIIGNKSSEAKGMVIKSKNGINFNTLVESETVSESQIFKPKLNGSLTSIWLDQNNTLYVAGDFFYRYKLNKWNYVTSFPNNYIGGNYYANHFGFLTGICGNKSNDMWVIGERNTVRHFNGVTWKQIGLPYDPNNDIIWLDVDVKNNIVAIVGSKGNQSAIMIIKR